MGSAEVHAAAAHGTSGPATALPYADQIQRAFGRHDVGHVQAHVDHRAAKGATAMGADAFAVGEHVAFAGTPDLHTAAHEAAHVVQQRAGVHLKGGVGEVGDVYEQHADAVADLVVQGKSAEALLDRSTGRSTGQRTGQHTPQGTGQAMRHPTAHAGPSATSSAAVQRHAFIDGKQVKKSDPITTDPAVEAFVTDDLVRNYQRDDELKAHAAKQTDYLGNLASDGTWLRFSPSGLNILGEMHTDVTFRQVTSAVGAKTFINERLSNDTFGADAKLKSAYESENAATFKEFGIDGEKDKQPFGAESLFPKMGQVVASLLPYLERLDAVKMEKLTREGNSDERTPNKETGKKLGGYDGQPFQRYLKMAWAYSQDVKARVMTKEAVGQKLPHALTELGHVVMSIEAEHGRFITDLPVDGFLGDALLKRENYKRWMPLASFCRAFINAMVERAVEDPSSRIADDKDKAKFSRASRTQDRSQDKDKKEMFDNWRNFQFEDSVKKAAHDHVRYAGMGWAHFEHLKGHLPPDSQAYDMNGDELAQFRTETARLKARAIKQ